MTLSLVLLVILILLSGFFSGSETALFSLQAIDRERLKEEGGAALTVLRLLEHPRRTLASVLMGNELVNISLSIVCAGLVMSVFPERPYLNLLVATPLLIIFGEVTPKTLALRNNRRFAMSIARPLALWAQLITPLRWLLQSLANLAIRVLGGSQARSEDRIEEEEVQRLIEEAHQAGQINAHEHELLQSVFDFGDMSVGRLMTPAPDMVRFSVHTSFSRLVEQLAKRRFSRIPMYEGTPDNVVGILLVKDLLAYKGKTPPSPSELRKHLKGAWFVPSSKPADDMLREFQGRREHLALVVDEHGGIDGLITLDDLLDELVGPNLDVHDDPEISVVQPGQWTVAGGMDLEDLAELTGVSLQREEVHTVGGFVMAELGEVPREGQELALEGIRIVVKQMDGRRIAEVELWRLGTQGQEQAAGK
ncbi:MAG TPA: hemolysin family protein [Myxococcota bacterium]|nr:hemolysin family protein [Myxococcota bacterium]